ncbi:arsenate reductase/protein-tyrosine-phosphatase family protein [Micromonospora sp. CPCC 206061]|uniref:arsenate reductase/protein-tyrosine-phosphatase family protein n=1 Tax=Micromonospora sp. CPCC 206061 TaxID=3122410 RepID=UPI002FF0C156
MLLFVCHANICRSPMAERLARQALAGYDGITAASAGTHASPDEVMHPLAARVLRECGADPDGFRSRPLAVELVATADIVLAATRQERASCAALAPPAIGRVFTIRQFGRLAAAVAVARTKTTMPELLEEVRAMRGSLQPVRPDEDDLADPVSGTVADFRACAAEIQRSLAPALALISPT